MIPLKVEIRAQYRGGLGSSRWFEDASKARQALDEATKAGFFEAGHQWFEQMMPEHFTPAGASKYGYANRTALYLIRRNRGGPGHPATTDPLTWSGRTKEMARSYGKTLATSAGVTVTMKVPSYIKNIMRRSGNVPNMASELTRVTPEEAELLAKTVIRTAVARLNGDMT